MATHDLRSSALFKLTLSDKVHKKLLDAKASGASVKSLKVKIEASHSGFVNGNKFFYSPIGMRDGIKSFVTPYQKAVTVNHDSELPPIGRVVDAEYISYGLDQGFEDSLGKSFENFGKKAKGVKPVHDAVKEFLASDAVKSPTYKGLGHASLTAIITDQEAIQKILDRRYLTVSIGGSTDKAICSVCGTDKKQAPCDHMRGETYDGQTCFYIGGLMDFDHVSYVNSPADPNAISEIITDSFGDSELDIIDFELEDNKGNTMFKTIQELLAAVKFADAKQKLDLTHVADSAPQEATGYLMPEEKALPLHDAVSIVVTHSMIQQLEDSEDKTAMLSVLDERRKNVCGEKTFEEILSDLLAQKQNVEDNTENTNSAEGNATAVFDNTQLVKEITDSVVSTIKSMFTVTDSFAGQRLRTVEKHNIELEKQNKALADKLKSVTVLQIQTLEKTISDSARQSVLMARSIDSLTDMLQDLSNSVDQSENSEYNTSNVNDSSNEEGNVSDNKENILEQNSVSISDANPTESEVDTNIEDSSGDNSSPTDAPVKMTVAEVKDKYLNTLRTQGLGAAKKEFQQLIADGKVPDNFTF